MIMMVMMVGGDGKKKRKRSSMYVIGIFSIENRKKMITTILFSSLIFCSVDLGFLSPP